MSGINLIRLGTSPSGASYFIGLISGAAQQNGNSVNIDSSGNFILGSASYNTANAFFFETIKLSPVGAISWQRQLGDNIAGRDSSNSSAVIDSSGNIYAAGYSANNFTTLAGCIAKYNSSGTIQWQVTLVNAQMLWNGIALDSVNSFLYAVGTYNNARWMIAKYNLTGVLQWQIDIDVGSSRGNGIVLDSSGNVYVTGKTPGVQPQYITIFKLNSSGVIQWQTRLDSSTGYGITLDSSNNVYVAGCTGSAGIGLISKHNSAGVFQWARTLGTAGLTSVTFYSVTLDSAGNIYVCGDEDTSRVVIAKYNSAGTISWQRQITNATVGTQLSKSIKIDSLGRILVFGTSTGSSSGPTMALLCVLPSDGSKTGTYTVSGYSFIYAASTKLDAAYSTTNTSTWATTTTTLTAATSTRSESASSLTSTVTTI